ncbi:MAG: hypothetical protein AAGI38_04425 [Bacteroidota bacterium]
MRNRLLILLIAIISLLAPSCVSHHSTFIPTIPVNEQGEPTYRVKGYAYGTYENFLIFHLPIYDSPSLLHEAREDMKQKYPLQDRQAYGNISVDIRRTQVYPLQWYKVMMVAEVLDWDSVKVTQQQP